MGARIYTDVVSVGGINIYNVTSGPNGVLAAPVGSLAVQNSGQNIDTWQNTDGGTAWSLVSERPTRDTIGLATSLSTYATIAPGPGGTTLAFTVPTDCTLKQFLLTSMGIVSTTDTDSRYNFRDLSILLYVTSITVDVGPDSGGNLISGVIPCRIFSTSSPDASPDLNIRCPAGATVSVHFVSLTSPYYVQIVPSWTCTPGIVAGQLPNTLIGVSSPTGVLTTPGAGAAANVMSITGLLSSGDTIEYGTRENNWTLTGVAGARTPGSDDFDATLGTPAALAAEIVAALNDPANSFSGITATNAPGPSDVTITLDSPGLLGNVFVLDASTGVILIPSPLFSGGTAGTATATFATTTRDLRIHELSITTFAGEGADVPQYINVTELRVSGSPVPGILGEIGATVFNPLFPNNNVPIDQFVGSGAGIAVDLQNVWFAPMAVFPVLFCRPA
jgi:hypothetical protein